MPGLLFYILLAAQRMLPSRPNLNEQSDLDIIAYYKKSKDKEALGILFKRYSHLVYGLCLKHLKNGPDSQDAVVNIFEKLMKDLLKHDVKHFKSWLYMVTKNFCLMQLRERQRETKREIDLIRSETMETVVPETAEEDLRELRLTTLEEAIAALKDEQRICIELFYLKQMCYVQVAEETGYTLKQVKSYIQNGKRNLKNILTNTDGEIFTG